MEFFLAQYFVDRIKENRVPRFFDEPLSVETLSFIGSFCHFDNKLVERFRIICRNRPDEWFGQRILKRNLTAAALAAGKFLKSINFTTVELWDARWGKVKWDDYVLQDVKFIRSELSQS